MNWIKNTLRKLFASKKNAAIFAVFAMIMVTYQNCAKENFDQASLNATQSVPLCPGPTVPCQTDLGSGPETCTDTSDGPVYGQCIIDQCNPPYSLVNGVCVQGCQPPGSTRSCPNVSNGSGSQTCDPDGNWGPCNITCDPGFYLDTVSNLCLPEFFNFKVIAYKKVSDASWTSMPAATSFQAQAGYEYRFKVDLSPNLQMVGDQSTLKVQDINAQTVSQCAAKADSNWNPMTPWGVNGPCGSNLANCPEFGSANDANNDWNYSTMSAEMGGCGWAGSVSATRIGDTSGFVKVATVTIDALLCTPNSTIPDPSCPSGSAQCSSDGRSQSCVPPSAVNGVCAATVNGKPSSTAPTGKICDTGTASNVTTTPTAFTWTCDGSNGGSSANCSAPGIYNCQGPVVPGAVACAYGNSGGLTSSVFKSVVATCDPTKACEYTCDTSKYTYSNGTCVPNACANGATNPPACTKCAAGNSMKNGQCTPNPVNGVCSPSFNGKNLSSAPSGNICSKGTASSVTTGVSTYTWTCSGANGGTSASCSANGTHICKGVPVADAVRCSNGVFANLTSSVDIKVYPSCTAGVACEYKCDPLTSTYSNGTCVPKTCHDGAIDFLTCRTCAPGNVMIGGKCVPQVCTPGSTSTDGCSQPTSGHGQGVKTCNAAGSAYGICQHICDSGYENMPGIPPAWSCQPYQCKGIIGPQMAYCAGETGPFSSVPHASKFTTVCHAGAQCEYTCKPGSYWDATKNQCVKSYTCNGPVPPSTIATKCQGNGGPSTEGLMNTIVSKCPSPELDQSNCDYTCNSGYTFSNGTCVKNTPPPVCTPGSTTSTGCPAVIHGSSVKTCNSAGTAYGSCVSSCNSGFVASGTQPKITCSCPSGTTLSGGKCVANPPPPPVCTPGSTTSTGCPTIANGSSVKTCNSAGTAYGSCKSTCDSGFTKSGTQPNITCSAPVACKSQNSSGPCKVDYYCGGTFKKSVSPVTLASVIDAANTPYNPGAVISGFTVPGYTVIQDSYSYKCDANGVWQSNSSSGYCEVRKDDDSSVCGGGSGNGGNANICTSQCTYEGQLLDAAGDCCKGGSTAYRYDQCHQRSDGSWYVALIDPLPNGMRNNCK